MVWVQKTLVFGQSFLWLSAEGIMSAALQTLLCLFCSNPDYPQPLDKPSSFPTFLSVVESSPRFSADPAWRPLVLDQDLQSQTIQTLFCQFLCSSTISALLHKRKQEHFSILQDKKADEQKSYLSRSSSDRKSCSVFRFCWQKQHCAVMKQALPTLSTRNKIIWIPYTISLSINNPKRSQSGYNTCGTAVRPIMCQLLIQHEMKVFEYLMIWLC